MRAPTFTDRRDAGRRLSQRLEKLAGQAGVVVLALPRGGVPVGIEVARALHAPLEVLEGRPLRAARWSTVVIVDDGAATAASLREAVRQAKELGAVRVILAAPVIAGATRDQLRLEADGIECVSSPDDLRSAAEWYRDFHEMSDAEAHALLYKYRDADGNGREAEMRAVRITAGDAHLVGDLCIPCDAAGLVLFAHGSGSSRLQPRNRDLAAMLQHEGFATLLLDLLTQREESSDRLTDAYSANIPLLSSRLITVTDWVATQRDVADLPLAYFGAEAGAAAAIVAATHRDSVQCIVARGGRPELAGDALGDVTAPTLFIMGGMDRQVLVATRGARERMRRAKTELSIIPGAGHLCEERGLLEEGARLAADWFRAHLVAPWVAAR